MHSILYHPYNQVSWRGGGVVNDPRDAVAAVLNKNSNDDDDGSINPTSTNHDHDSTTVLSHSAESSAGATHSHLHDTSQQQGHRQNWFTFPWSQQQGWGRMHGFRLHWSKSFTDSFIFAFTFICIQIHWSESLAFAWPFSSTKWDTRRHWFLCWLSTTTIPSTTVAQFALQVARDQGAARSRGRHKPNCLVVTSDMQCSSQEDIVQQRIHMMRWFQHCCSLFESFRGVLSPSMPGAVVEHPSTRWMAIRRCCVFAFGWFRWSTALGRWSFIGQRLGRMEDQQSLQVGLDRCLLNNDEWASYWLKRASKQRGTSASYFCKWLVTSRESGMKVQ